MGEKLARLHRLLEEDVAPGAAGALLVLLEDVHRADDQRDVIRRRIVLDADKIRVKVSYVCDRGGNACDLVEQYLERNLRDFVPYLPTVPSQATLGEDRCDPR